MITREFMPSEFASTYAAVDEGLKSVELGAGDSSVAVFGGSARSGLVEVVLGDIRPIRDIDIVAFGDSCSDERFAEIHHALNPDDTAPVKVVRYPDIVTLFEKDIDFTINQAVIEIGESPKLTVSSLAIDAGASHLVIPTEGRIRATKEQEAGGEDAAKSFLRSRTSMPARAAYFVAIFRAAGIDFDYDLLDHPKPQSPDEAHTFFLGLMVRKALMVDEAERGNGDITATRVMIDIFREMNMTRAAMPRRVEDVVSYCESINSEHPHLKFYGSEVSNLVNHT